MRSTRGLVIFPASPGVVAMVKLHRLFRRLPPSSLPLRYRVVRRTHRLQIAREGRARTGGEGPTTTGTGERDVEVEAFSGGGAVVSAWLVQGEPPRERAVVADNDLEEKGERARWCSGRFAHSQGERWPAPARFRRLQKPGGTESALCSSAALAMFRLTRAFRCFVSAFSPPPILSHTYGKLATSQRP